MGRFLYFSIVFCIYSTLSAFAAETKDGLPFVLGHLGKKIKLRIELLKPLSLPEPTGGEFRHQPTYRVYFQNGSAIPEDLDRPFVSKIRPFPGAPDLNFNEPYCALTVRGRSEHGRKGRVLPKGAKMIFVENDYFKAEALVENTAEKLRITEGHYTKEKL